MNEVEIVHQVATVLTPLRAVNDARWRTLATTSRRRMCPVNTVRETGSQHSKRVLQFCLDRFLRETVSTLLVERVSARESTELAHVLLAATPIQTPSQIKLLGNKSFLLFETTRYM